MNLQEAAVFIAQAWPCFPCGADKRPITAHGFKDATSDPEQVWRLFRAPGAAMIGVPTGAASDLVVVDLDVKNGGAGLEWLAANEHRLPATRRHRTRSGGMHLLFRYPAGRSIRNSASKLAPGVDIRGEGGYIIAPPSPGYVIDTDAMPAEMPAWLVALLDPPPAAIAPSRPARPLQGGDGTPWGLSGLARECDRIRNAPDGAKHDTLNRAAYSIGGLVAGGDLAEGPAFAALSDALEALRPRCEDFRAAEKTLAGAFRQGMAAPRQSPPPREVRHTVRIELVPEPEPVPYDDEPEHLMAEPAMEPVAEMSGSVRARPGTHLEDRSDTYPTLTIDDLMALPPPEWLIKGVITVGSNAVLYGPWASLKSFACLDMALCLAYGRPWQGREVKPVGVLYIAGEGARGMAKRVLAWQMRQGLETVQAPFRMLCAGVNLTDPQHVAKLIRTALAAAAAEGVTIGLIVIDTLARAMVGADENSSQDMGRAIRATDEIREEVQTATLTVHHSGKDAEKGTRGSSALPAGADTLLRVEREEMSVTLTIEKQKDDEEGEPITLKAEKVMLTEAEDGPSSLVLVAANAGDNSSRRPSGRLSGDQQLAIRILHDALATHGEPDFPGVPGGLRSIPEGWWRERFYDRAKPGADQQAKQKAFRRAADALVSAGLAAANKGRVWATKPEQ